MKKSKEPTLGDFLTDIEGLLKDFKKSMEIKYKDFLPKDNLDSKK